MPMDPSEDAESDCLCRHPCHNHLGCRSIDPSEDTEKSIRVSSISPHTGFDQLANDIGARL